MHVHFVESQTPTAKPDLNELANSLRDTHKPTSIKLLKSREQPDLYLLIIESSYALEFDVPADCKRWSFEAVE